MNARQRRSSAPGHPRVLVIRQIIARMSLGATPTVVAPFRLGVLFERSIGRTARLTVVLLWFSLKLLASIYQEGNPLGSGT